MVTVVDVAVALVVLIGSLAGSSAALRFLGRRQILDRPNERSSHSKPTLRGLGLAVVPSVLAGWLGASVLLPDAPVELRPVCAAALCLAVVSWLDDIKRLPVAPRLVAQIVAVVAGVYLLEPPPVFGALGVSPLADRCLTGLLWLGLINQVNFTDGIDGHLGTMLVSSGIGLFLVLLVAHSSPLLGALSLTLAAGAAGFLWWNWHPAKGFLGDVGSVPLGYLVGWLLLRAASIGLWAPVVILPLFYFADTAVTYSRRILRGQAFWRPHREYLYQRAATRMRHSDVVKAILPCNACLIVLAATSARGASWPCLGASVAVVALTYAYLARRVRRQSEAGNAEAA
jgi:UDP-N-acetylmuramyl pentapeptide phosphotransferase/UDP-N-acetylglucosamine-1-phosphate transferase